MNKGLEIRAKKLEKKAKKRNTVKNTQMGVCRFISFNNPLIQRINGKYKFIGFQVIDGLQIENKLYYVENDKISYIFMNKQRAKILKIYNESEIDTFHPLLLKRYSEETAKQALNTNTAETN